MLCVKVPLCSEQRAAPFPLCAHPPPPPPPALRLRLEPQRYYLNCLAHASYLVYSSATKRAVVIDPRRDIAPYMEDAKEMGLSLQAILLTHMHADFVAGHGEFHQAGIPVLAGAAAGLSMPHTAIRDGDEPLALSARLAVRPMLTPGHTPGCVSFVVEDGGVPVKAFTGDTLFIGSVGRPDLVASAGATKEEMSVAMFASLRKLTALPDSCEVWPAHGAGSPCGKNLSDAECSTIGAEKATNPALQLDELGAFMAWHTAGLGNAPQYFSAVVAANAAGPAGLEHVLGAVPELELDAFDALRLAEEAIVIDTRNSAAFRAGHLVGAINLPVGIHGGEEELAGADEGNFGIWVGTLIPPGRPLLVVAPEGGKPEALTRLSRVGYEAGVRAVLSDAGAAALAAAAARGGDQRVGVLAEVTTVPGDGLPLQPGDVVVDVRTKAEYSCLAGGHVKGAINVQLCDLKLPVVQLPEALAALAADGTPHRFLCYCIGGYRSSIAASLLKAAGIDAVNCAGGYEHIKSVAPDSCTARRAE